jgi:CheY-like chemotaxis protein
MKREGRILVLDDEPHWRDILSGVLRREGYRVDEAESIAQAHEYLRQNFYHVGVFDVSMVKGDAENTEGMRFLSTLDEDGIRDAMEVMLISAYADKERLRRAFTQYKVADFQDKYEFNEGEFLGQVRRILSGVANLDLNIHWEGADQREQTVINMEIDGERAKRNSPLQEQLAIELDDLLCRLFSDAQSLLVKPLTPGNSGAAVLKATPFYEFGAAQPVVVKFGFFRKAHREYQNFNKYVKPFIGGGRSTSLLNMRLTTHLGGITYSLLGSVGDRFTSFGSFYPGADASKVKEILNHLFHETCGAWYANPGNLQLHNLTEEYQRMLGFTEENLTRALSQVKGVQGTRQLYFDSLGKNAFKNPIMAAAERQFVRPTYSCITHGDLNASNILVDDSGLTWLIDFETTELGHILRDIAELDTVVRFQLLKPEEASLSERLKMEEALCGASQFGDVARLESAFQTDNAALAKAFATAVSLRAIAYELVSKNPTAELDEYYIPLFYYSINALRFLSWPGLQRQHALLAASLLADKLGL